jgi:hypothetical protein
VPVTQCHPVYPVVSRLDAQRVQVVAPGLHHRSPLGQILGVIVCASRFVTISVSKLGFDPSIIPSELMQLRRSQRPEPDITISHHAGEQAALTAMEAFQHADSQRWRLSLGRLPPLASALGSIPGRGAEPSARKARFTAQSGFGWPIPVRVRVR